MSEPEFDQELETLWASAAEAGPHRPTSAGTAESEGGPASPRDSSPDSKTSSSSDVVVEFGGLPESDEDIAAAADEAQPANAPPSPASSNSSAHSRHRHEFSHTWGSFRVTWKRPRTWFCTCLYHARAASTKCTKSVTVATDSAEDRALGLRKLKAWCLRAGEHANRESHMGSRGLRLTPEELALTDAQLDERMKNLPPPDV